MATRDEILARLDADDPAGAAQVAREILAGSPRNADVLGLLGLALEAGGDREAGADALRSAVALPADPAITLRNTTNLAAMLIGAGRKADAATVLQGGWQWPRDAAVGDNERRCIVLLADMMKLLELGEELVAFLLPIAEREPSRWDLRRRAALALAAAGRHEDALRLLEASTVSESEEPDRQAILAYAHIQLGHAEKAVAAHEAYKSHTPPYVAPGKADQWFTIGVLNPPPMGETLIAPERGRHFDANYPAQLLDRLAGRYRFASILLGAGPSAVEKFREQGPSVLINNIVNAEILLDGSTLAAVQALAGSVEAPVINPPDRAALCTRQMNSERFAGIPNLVTPRFKRLVLDLDRLDEIVALTEQSFAYPMIVRTVADQQSMNITLVENRQALQETLQQMQPTQPQVYVIQFAGVPHKNGCYRKLRAAFVEGVPVVMRADYARHWVVQGRKWPAVQELYRDHPDLLADADDIVRRPHIRLGPHALTTLQTIGRLLPLEIFGVDFDVDESGRVVFFEANASMNLFSNAPAELDYPPSADATLLEYIEALLHRRSDAAAASRHAEMRS
jgi:Flp pilus assembly protein TadD/glutathione synthase/RimK-type ligase-like ATP-grasp enzyme